MPLNQPAVWLIAYDIRSSKRLASVRKAVIKIAVPVQYSLYMALGSQNQIDILARQLELIIDPKDDDVRIYRVPNDPEFHSFGLQRCQIPLVLPTSFAPGAQRFVHVLFDVDGKTGKTKTRVVRKSPLVEELQSLERAGVSSRNQVDCNREPKEPPP